mmetsp:Transcript_35843/g.92222  ORF Transcript_35843/g.92222 Transcript_35843/m.92222 type:complete len:292 (+) Transcript_35843:1505-2380(+)
MRVWPVQLQVPGHHAVLPGLVSRPRQARICLGIDAEVQADDLLCQVDTTCEHGSEAMHDVVIAQGGQHLIQLAARPLGVGPGPLALMQVRLLRPDVLSAHAPLILLLGRALLHAKAAVGTAAGGLRRGAVAVVRAGRPDASRSRVCRRFTVVAEAGGCRAPAHLRLRLLGLERRLRICGHPMCLAEQCNRLRCDEGAQERGVRARHGDANLADLQAIGAVPPLCARRVCAPSQCARGRIQAHRMLDLRGTMVVLRVLGQISLHKLWVANPCCLAALLRSQLLDAAVVHNQD